MTAAPTYQRVLVKISGEALSGTGEHGLDAGAIETLIGELRQAVDLGVQIGLVVGAGNLMRGRDLAGLGDVERTTADSMGMLATVINGLALGDLLRGAGLDARTLSAIPMGAHCEAYVRARAIAHLQAGRIVILAGGTGSPFFTTDMCAALRAAELGCDVMIKATKVDGVFSQDPVENPDAVKYDHLTYQQVLAERLKVMDLTAVSMCMENSIPMMVFELTRPGNLASALSGRAVGTRITDQPNER